MDWEPGNPGMVSPGQPELAMQPLLWQDTWQAGKFWLELGLQADCYKDGGQNKVKSQSFQGFLGLGWSSIPNTPWPQGQLGQWAVLELWALGPQAPRQKSHSNASATHQDQERALQV